MGHQATGAAAGLPPHVLIFPLPLHGHVNSMLKLAELLCLSHLHVTMLLSDHNHRRHADVESHFSQYSGFRIATISDGLPDDHPRVGQRSLDILTSLMRVGGEEFRRLMEATDALSGGGSRRRVSCVIMDGVLSFAVPVAKEIGIPIIYFRTVSACAFWANYSFKEVVEAGEVPLKGKDEDKYSYGSKPELDLLVTSVPGMEGYLRRRDLPGFCRVSDVNDAIFSMIATETRQTSLVDGLILNTFEDLEGPILDQIRKPIPTLYSIGPLHAHLQARLETDKKNRSLPAISLWEEDHACMAWLDTQPARSVLYVSFGSITLLSKKELLELWYGLVNSGQRFLWAMRPDSIVEGDGESFVVPAELEEGTKARGHMAGWVPQNKVLMHSSLAAFFTHSGWNSTLESITVGIPMICWPYFADQTINSRFVSEIWKIGLDMKDTCDRAIVERMVRDVMEVRKDEFFERARRTAELVKKAINEGGSSYANWNRLIEFLKSTIL
ncbi:7-deoxyloganetic acid glucosyl transferase-like [Andrographis paniculata]|uniref:7-deoxyloganetic acid glucosyl transferase-like n=1 Tax=Andrographis paniculata TaxID=175694 RepID=UPI0021E91835|nr:7-deoxyloganetic acid glucosyl transferase-like [Andrographis paniculata]